MLGLAIHTSSPELGLMLQSIDEATEPVKRHQVWELGREVSSHLHEKMIEFVAPHSWQDLGFIAVATGPGGFTGTRIGVVAARTLAQQLDLPLFGVSSLAAIAHPHSHIGKDIAISMAAKREAVFGAVYRPIEEDLSAVRFDEVMPVADWEKMLNQWEHPVTQVSIPARTGLGETVKGVMGIAIARYRKGDRPDWSTVMPFYGQHPVHR
ncbi:MAG: tRNA (adenosine(37)-N6)-threonylcarbamoyltransferase complex dimerization subunit type 1 TsaB [Cyanobacteria bacterium J06581_3]